MGRPAQRLVYTTDHQQNRETAEEGSKRLERRPPRAEKQKSLTTDWRENIPKIASKRKSEPSPLRTAV